jgi:tRNA pseudouridine32 synthase/23S rRNA pseudouridine746 synthase/23S rRNA pseudouridine1911/1915/1917 synthase
VTDWAELLASHTVLDDDALLVLDKPAGLSVTGERHDTDLVRIAKDAGTELFPVHRIDKVTSGLILLARRLDRHGDLTRQFAKRTVDKAYLALTRSTGLPASGTIDLPLSEGRKNRVRVAAAREAIATDGERWSVPEAEAFTHVRTYPSVTTFRRLWAGPEHTLLELHPLTGRRHQIRVHLAWIGHPIEGDPLFDKSATGRTCLHSWQLAFDTPWEGDRRIQARADPGEDFWAPAGGQVPAGLLERA